MVNNDRNLPSLINELILEGMVPISELLDSHNNSVEWSMASNVATPISMCVSCKCVDEWSCGGNHGQNLPKLVNEVISEGMVPVSELKGLVPSGKSHRWTRGRGARARGRRCRIGAGCGW